MASQRERARIIPAKRSTAAFLSKTIFLFSFISICMTMIGCARPIPNILNDSPLRTEELRLHTVTYQGETLQIISEWYTGNVNNWTNLRTYNGHLRTYSSLPIGTVVRLPSPLLVRGDQMTEEFVANKKRVKKIRSSRNDSAKKNKSSTHASSNEELSDEKLQQEESLNNQNEEKITSQDQLIENLLGNPSTELAPQ